MKITAMSAQRTLRLFRFVFSPKDHPKLSTSLKRLSNPLKSFTPKIVPPWDTPIPSTHPPAGPPDPIPSSGRPIPVPFSGSARPPHAGSSVGQAWWKYSASRSSGP
jgi:hypothetical protein